MCLHELYFTELQIFLFKLHFKQLSLWQRNREALFATSDMFFVHSVSKIYCVHVCEEGFFFAFFLILKSWFNIFSPFLYQKPLILSCFSILHGTPAFQRLLLLSPPPSQAECWPSLGEGLPIRGWLLSAGGRMSPIQVSLGYRRGLKSKPQRVLWSQ